MIENTESFKPTIDPSTLTTQQLWREISALKTLFDAQLEAMNKAITVAHEDLVRVPTDVQKQVGNLKDLQDSKLDALKDQLEVIDQKILSNRVILETRLEGMDKAIEVLQVISDKLTERMDEKISAATRVHEERFRSIQTQFSERDARSDQTSKDSKVALDTALQAAKEAVGEQNRSSALAIAKSEAATMKQIDQLGLLIQTMTKAFDDKIDDAKERLTRIEGKGEGNEKTKQSNQTSMRDNVALIGMIFAVVTALIAIGITIFTMKAS